MMTVIVTVFEAAGLTMSEYKTEIMLLRAPDQACRTSPLVVEAAGQKYITDDPVTIPGRRFPRER